MKNSPADSHRPRNNTLSKGAGRRGSDRGAVAGSLRSRRKPFLCPAGVILSALLGCSFHTGPITPPTDGPGDCSTATANLVELGCEQAEGFEPKCRDAQAAEAKLGIAYPVGCLTAAKSCEAARACR